MPRRSFLSTAGKAAALTIFSPFTSSSALEDGPPEQLIRRLHDSLNADQQGRVLLPWGDRRRLKVRNNWRAVRESIGRFYTGEQRALIRGIVQGVTSEQGFDKLMRTMQDDHGGFERYSVCLFGKEDGALTFLLTGRHQTLRASVGADGALAFGGPMFYGHAVEFYERPDHPGNAWWHQARLASKVFYALDSQQRERALVQESPADRAAAVQLLEAGGSAEGISLGDLADDQQALVEDVIREMLAMYPTDHVGRIVQGIRTNGGWDQMHLAFYREGDLADEEGIWDRWKLTGPSLSWYFRGSPHVHAWIHMA